MKKFYFTHNNINLALRHLMFEMTTKEVTSIELDKLCGDICLPGGGYIYSENATVLLMYLSISDFKIVIRRDDRRGESHEYPLDYITIQWIKDNKIRVDKKI